MKYVLVAINLPVKNLFRQFIYSLPEALPYPKGGGLLFLLARSSWKGLLYAA